MIELTKEEALSIYLTWLENEDLVGRGELKDIAKKVRKEYFEETEEIRLTFIECWKEKEKCIYRKYSEEEKAEIRYIYENT